MDDNRFDALSRALGSGTSRRGVLSLAAGLAGLGLGEAAAKRRKRGKGRGKGKATASKKAHKITICHRTGSATNPVKQLKVDKSAVPAHRAHGDAIDPDFQTDGQNCGGCGNACAGGDACNAPACQQGRCGTTPTPDVACDSGTGPGSGTCDASGQCQRNAPVECAGSPSTICFVRDGAHCGNHNPPCHCLTGRDGTPFCSENVYCNTVDTECETNDDCVTRLHFPAGSVCMSAEPVGWCCPGGARTGCATPCS